MGIGLKRDKPNEYELRSAALEADEHFCGLPVEVQDLQRRALVDNYDHYLRTRKLGLERYKSAMILGVGVMILFWGMGSAPRVDTFVAAAFLGVLLGAVTERLEGGMALFAIGCGLFAFLLGLMTGSFHSLFFTPVIATVVGAVFGTTRWL